MAKTWDKSQVPVQTEYDLLTFVPIALILQIKLSISQYLKRTIESGFLTEC